MSEERLETSYGPDEYGQEGPPESGVERQPPEADFDPEGRQNTQRQPKCMVLQVVSQCQHRHLRHYAQT